MSTAVIAEARRGLVARARKVWRERLIDLTRRNNLLYYRPLKLGSYDLNGFDEQALLELLAGGSALLTRLIPAAKLEGAPESAGEDPAELSAEQLGAARRLVEVQRKADENFEERGLETMFLAFGLASWTTKDGGRESDAAVLLVPLKLEGKEQRRALRRRGDIELNLALLYVLEREYEVQGLGEQLAALLPDEDEGLRDMRTYEEVFETLERAAAHIPGFQVKRRAVIGNFSFQKLAMVKDLEAWGDAMAANDIVAALAGDTDARIALGRPDPSEGVESLDREPPENQFLGGCPSRRGTSGGPLSLH